MGNANSLQVLGLSGNAASTNPQLDKSVDFTIARLSNKVKGMGVPLPPDESINLTSNNIPTEMDIFSDILKLLGGILTNTTTPQAQQNASIPTPTNSQVASTHNNEAFRLFYQNSVGKQYTDYQA